MGDCSHALFVCWFLRFLDWVAGYPLVNCTTSPAGPSTEWSCSQSRFYSYTPATRASTQWTIYLTATTPASPSPLPLWWASSASAPLTFTVPSSTAYVKLNTNTTGFFRVLYDAPSYAALSAALNTPGYSGIKHDDRLGLVNDAFVLTSLRYQSWPQTLNMSLFLQRETSFPVWEVALPSLEGVYNYLKYHNDTARGLYQSYMAQAMSGVASRLNISAVGQSSISDAILESILGYSLVRFNVSGRVEPLRQIFDQLFLGLISLSSINPNVVDLVLEAGTVNAIAPSRWQWVFDNVYLAKINQPANNNDTDYDARAALGYPQIIVTSPLTNTTHTDMLPLPPTTPSLALLAVLR